MWMASGGGKALAEGCREDGIAVHDHRLNGEPIEKADARHGEVAGALERDVSIGVFGDVDNFDLTRAQVDGDQDRYQADGTVVEDEHFGEVNRGSRVGIMHDDFIVCGNSTSLGRGRNAMSAENCGDRGFGERNTLLFQLPDNPLCAPGITAPIVLQRKLDDQCFDFSGCSSATSRSLPLIRNPNQSPMPATHSFDRCDFGDFCNTLPPKSVPKPSKLAAIIIGEVSNGSWPELLEEISLEQNESSQFEGWLCSR